MTLRPIITAALFGLAAMQAFADPSATEDRPVLEAGHPSLQEWVLPEVPKMPKNNRSTPDRVALGEKLFFEPGLSGDGKVSCATCHDPALGWSDGQRTALGFGGKRLHRASPTVVNTAYNTIQMWDGRARSLEQQALGPMRAADEMNASMDDIVAWLQMQPEYVVAFESAYPQDGVSLKSLAKAIAAFERTIVSRNSPFDQWVQGDVDALSDAQIRGFEVFLDPGRGNCVVCHAPPNFTDDGFHNIGLASYLEADPDLGRFEHVPIGVLKGAFKTPTLRDVTLTAPYFHDGSAATLRDVIDHYERGGDTDKDLSPNMKPLKLSPQDKDDLVAFLSALTSPSTYVPPASVETRTVTGPDRRASDRSGSD